jgi:hypothetical protein
MSLIDIYNAANEPTFQGRCRVATWAAAQDISNEGPETVEHQKRMDWATRVQTDRTNITDRQLAMQVLRNSVIASDPAGASDGDIQYQVATVLADLIRIG